MVCSYNLSPALMVTRAASQSVVSDERKSQLYWSAVSIPAASMNADTTLDMSMPVNDSSSRLMRPKPGKKDSSM